MEKIMQFATEEEMYEILGDDAKGFDMKSGWGVKVKEGKEEEKVAECMPEKQKHILIGAYICNNYMYLAHGTITFIKGVAEKFVDSEEIDKKIAAMNRHGHYKWEKIEATG